MFKICLIVLIGAFLVKFIRDVESRNELLLDFSFSFLFGYYIGNCISYIFHTIQEKQKSSVEIELVIKYYNAAASTSFDKFLHSEKNEEKEVWMVQTRSDDLHWRFEIWTVCWGYGLTFFSR